MSRIKVLMLFGGESTEHTVSIASARNVFDALDATKYEVTLCYIDASGKWWQVRKIVDNKPDDADELLPQLGHGTFVTKNGIQIVVDVILPILHGRNGEDGAVQALAQLLHIPIVGCDMASSSLAMNKLATKRIVGASGIPIVDYRVHNVGDALPNFDLLSDSLGSTLFVKPVNAGSSVGVSKVTNQDDLEVSLDEAHRHDSVVLIEKAIDARELEVAVIGRRPNVETSVVGEIKPEGEFYSYESKYDDLSTSMVVIPAKILPELNDQLRGYASDVFDLLGCSGMARVDFFVDRKDGKVYLNEVNTIPGFTDISMYPKLWEHAGINYSTLIEKLITSALEK